MTPISSQTQHKLASISPFIIIKIPRIELELEILVSSYQVVPVAMDAQENRGLRACMLAHSI